MSFDTNFTITKDNSNITLGITTGESFNWPIKNTCINTVGSTGNLIVVGDANTELIQLDYTKSTDPAPGPNRASYITTICQLVEYNDYPIVGITGTISVDNFPVNQVVNGIIGVTGSTSVGTIDGIVGITSIQLLDVGVTKNGIIDSNNSTTVALLAGATFTGTYTDCSEYSEFTCLVSTDVSGTLYMDMSTDGVNIDRTKTSTMKTGGVHTLVIVSQYMKIRYVNDSTGQSYLRLQTIFHKFKSKDLTSTTSQIICDINDVSLVRVVNNTFLDFARGVVSDKSSNLIFGRNPSIGTAFEDIWYYGGDYNFLTGATTFNIISNSAQDDASGLGARSVLINGLDSNLNELSEVISLTGSGTVTTVNSYWRLHSAYVASVGTNRGSNYNNIDIQSTGSSLELGQIGGGYGTINTANYGIGRTQLGIITVPAGKSLYITAIYVNVDSSKTADVALYCLSNIDDTTIPTSPRILLAQIDGMHDSREKVLRSYWKILEKSDIWFRAKINTGSAGIGIEFEYFLIDD